MRVAKHLLIFLIIIIALLVVYIKFLENYEKKFLSQGLNEQRSLVQSLDLGWEVLRCLPRNLLTLMEDKFLDEYHWFQPENETATLH